MYTVVRFCADETCSDETLKELGVRLNSIVDNAYDGRLDHAGHRFSVSVSSNDEWGANLAETLRFIREVLPLAEAARTSGVYLEVDTAVDSKDLRNRPWLSCSLTPDASLELARARITHTITIYRGAWKRESEDPGDELESRLQLLLACEPFASDDRKLARVYLAIAREFRSLLPPPLREELENALSVQRMDFESRLAHAPGRRSGTLDTRALKFLAKLVASAARPEFTIRPIADSLPISLGVAFGVPVGVMKQILAAEYPIAPGYR